MKRTYNFIIAVFACFSLLMATDATRCYAGAPSFERVNIAGADLFCTLTYDKTYVCASATFSGGSGTIEATARGFYRDEASHEVRISSFGSNPTPGGISVTVNCPEGYSFFEARGEYAVDCSRGKDGTFIHVPVSQ